MSWARYLTLKTFRDLNPSWEIVLWTSDVCGEGEWDTGEKQDFADAVGPDYRNQLRKLRVKVRDYKGACNNPIHSADLCRWDVLAEGGIFADMDILWVRPVSEAHLDVLRKPGLTWEGVYRIGLVSGGKPFVPIAELAHSRKDLLGYQSLGVDVLYLYGVDLAALSEKVGEIGNIPRHWVHGIDPGAVIFQSYAIEPDRLGIHWFGGDFDGHNFACTASPDFPRTGLLAHLGESERERAQRRPSWRNRVGARERPVAD